MVLEFAKERDFGLREANQVVRISLCDAKRVPGGLEK